jgi:TetR/AcrR family transcriptional regulator
VKVIDDWIARGLLAPVNAQTLMYMIWATTQHYADFDAQIRALKGKRALTQKAFEVTTEEVVQLVIRACGAVSPERASVGSGSRSRHEDAGGASR